jgi:hypothetical protein
VSTTFRSTRRLAVTTLVLAALACGHGHDDDHEHEASGSSDREGLAMCCELGNVCHPGDVEQDPIGGEVRTCHDLGHQNDPEACRASYDACLVACTGGREPEGDGEHSCL